MRVSEPVGAAGSGGRSILLIDDQPAFLESLGRALADAEFRVSTARDFGEAKAEIERAAPTYVISELRVGSGSLLGFLPEVAATVPAERVVVVTVYPSIATAVTLTRMGVAGYLTKPASPHALLDIFAGKVSPGADAGLAQPLSWPSLDRTIWEYLCQVHVAAGSTAEAARRLGLDRRSLRRMLAKYPPAA